MNIFQKGNFKLHSGKASGFKIECDALKNSDWKCLAYLISKKISFSYVVGIPKGGLKLEKELRKYEKKDIGIVLIVDDVLTTGKSMEEKKKEFESLHKVEIKGAVVFARGKCAAWITPIFTMCDEN